MQLAQPRNSLVVMQKIYIYGPQIEKSNLGHTQSVVMQGNTQQSMHVYCIAPWDLYARASQLFT